MFKKWIQAEHWSERPCIGVSISCPLHSHDTLTKFYCSIMLLFYVASYNKSCLIIFYYCFYKSVAGSLSEVHVPERSTACTTPQPMQPLMTHTQVWLIYDSYRWLIHQSFIYFISLYFSSLVLFRIPMSIKDSAFFLSLDFLSFLLLILKLSLKFSLISKCIRNLIASELQIYSLSLWFILQVNLA